MNKFPDKIGYEELTPEGFMCSDNEEKGKILPYSMAKSPETIGFGSTVESTNSIYDNVSSPWKDFKLSLLGEDSSKGSGKHEENKRNSILDDELWEGLSRNRPKVVYDQNGKTSTTKESLSVTAHLQVVSFILICFLSSTWDPDFVPKIIIILLALTSLLSQRALHRQNVSLRFPATVLLLECLVLVVLSGCQRARRDRTDRLSPVSLPLLSVVFMCEKDLVVCVSIHAKLHHVLFIIMGNRNKY